MNKKLPVSQLVGGAAGYGGDLQMQFIQVPLGPQGQIAGGQGYTRTQLTAYKQGPNVNPYAMLSDLAVMFNGTMREPNSGMPYYYYAANASQPFVSN